MEEVVTLRPNLQDICEHLRTLADGIENGDFGEVTTLFVIIPKAGHDWPDLFGYGIDAESPQFVFQMELAKTWLVNNVVKRI